jgi:hypothetical protein
MIVVAVAFIVPNFLYLVEDLGHRIPQEDMQTDYVIGVVWAIILGVSILAWPVSSRDKRCLLLVWLAKLIITLGFMLFYESHYPLDSYGYFDTSRQDSYIWEGFSYAGSSGGTHNVTRLAWLHHQLVPDSFHALKISFAMLGLIAVYLFYRAAVLFLKREDRRVLYALALFPSILFWSSGVGKEPIVLLIVALHVYGVVGWYRTKMLRYFIIMLLGVIIMGFFRVWMVPIMLVSLVPLLVSAMRGVVAKTILLLFVLVACLLITNKVQNILAVDTKQDMVAKVNNFSRGFARGGSARKASGKFTDISSMIAFVPKGSFTALFRPLPGEVMNSFGLLAGIENLFLLILLLLSLKHFRYNWRELQDPLVLWAVLLVLTWAAVYGFVSSYNLGTASRYRLQILPILLGLLIYLARSRRIQKL